MSKKQFRPRYVLEHYPPYRSFLEWMIHTFEANELITVQNFESQLNDYTDFICDESEEFHFKKRSDGSRLERAIHPLWLLTQDWGEEYKPVVVELDGGWVIMPNAKRQLSQA